MDYFEKCSNEEEAKEVYFAYAKKLHPDYGGSEEEFNDLKEKYELCKTKMNFVEIPEVSSSEIVSLAKMNKFKVSKKNADGLKKGMSMVGGSFGAILTETLFEKISNKYFDKENVN